MILKGLLLILGIILFGVLTMVSVVFSIIYFANSKKGKFGWLGIFIGSLIVLLTCIYFTVSSVVNKAKDVAENFESKFRTMAENSMIANDTTPNITYFSDSISLQVNYLKALEPAKYSNNVPPAFYNYLGFRDYYRMPITYPYSLHCTDFLGDASLYNEEEVTEFDKNDNGEIASGLEGINEFTFDSKMLLAKRNLSKTQTEYVIYLFEQKETEEIETLEKLKARAKVLKFSKPVTLVTCKEYFDGF